MMRRLHYIDNGPGREPSKKDRRQFDAYLDTLTNEQQEIAIAFDCEEYNTKGRSRMIHRLRSADPRTALALRLLEIVETARNEGRGLYAGYASYFLLEAKLEEHKNNA